MFDKTNERFQRISIALYPFKWWLLASWVAGAFFVNILKLGNELVSNLIVVFMSWPFYLWFIVFLWGHPEKQGYKKTPTFIMLIYGTCAVVGMVMLPIVTIASFYRIYIEIINS